MSKTEKTKIWWQSIHIHVLHEIYAVMVTVTVIYYVHVQPRVGSIPLTHACSKFIMLSMTGEQNQTWRPVSSAWVAAKSYKKCYGPA